MVKNEVKSYREAKNLTQDQLAQMVDVSRQTIISIETGKYRASLELALKLSAYFKVPVEKLFKLGE